MSRATGYLFALVGLLASCSIGNASTINFSGNFIFDDDVQFFSYQSPIAGVVTVNTFSFANGGFAPILALYDVAGTLLFTADGPANNDCTVAGQADVRGTGFCYDTQVVWNSDAGATYYVALSQYSNFPIADIPVAAAVSTWNNGTTFTEFGNHFFTGTGPFGPGCPPQSGFCLNDGNARGTNWAVTFNGPAGLVVHAPETGSIFLILGGLAILCGKLLRTRMRKPVVRL